MKQKDWFKDRGYLHFSSTTPISQRKKIESYISNRTRIAKHSFYPLIFKEIIQRRYKISDFGGVKKRSHKVLKNGELTSNKKIRQILYATHIDAHIYSYYTKLLSSRYETYLNNRPELSDSITAYRRIRTSCDTRFKNNVHFANDVFGEIRKRQNCVALAFDIENFFPSLDHGVLKRKWTEILGTKSLPKDHFNIFKAVTRFSYVRLKDLKRKGNHFDEKELARIRKSGKKVLFNQISDLLDTDIIIHKNQRHNNAGEIIGIPQGLPISSLLANIYMLSFDEAVLDVLGKKHNIYYRRYSDDIVIICEKGQISLVENFLKEKIKQIKLNISIPKTEKILFKYDNNKVQSFGLKENSLIKNQPFNYLGFEFYGYQTLLKSKNLASFYREMKGAVRRRNKRAERIKEKYLLDAAPLFKRKLYRLYSFKGEKTRLLPFKKSQNIGGQMVVQKFDRKYRGNYLRYAYRASEEMKAPEIRRQMRNHWKILQSTIQKYEFSNVNKD